MLCYHLAQYGSDHLTAAQGGSPWRQSAPPLLWLPSASPLWWQSMSSIVQPFQGVDGAKRRDLRSSRHLQWQIVRNSLIRLTVRRVSPLPFKIFQNSPMLHDPNALQKCIAVIPFIEFCGCWSGSETHVRSKLKGPAWKKHLKHDFAQKPPKSENKSQSHTNKEPMNRVTGTNAHKSYYM